MIPAPSAAGAEASALQACNCPVRLDADPSSGYLGAELESYLSFTITSVLAGCLTSYYIPFAC